MLIGNNQYKNLLLKAVELIYISPGGDGGFYLTYFEGFFFTEGFKRWPGRRKFTLGIEASH